MDAQPIHQQPDLSPGKTSGVRLPFRLFLGILVLAACLAGASLAQTARADGGGQPTRTPTSTPVPTATFTSTPTVTIVPVLNVVNTPVPIFPTSTSTATPLPNFAVGQSQPIPTPTPAGTGFSILACWPFALIAILAIILASGLLLWRQALRQTVPVAGPHDEI